MDRVQSDLVHTEILWTSDDFLLKVQYNDYKWLNGGFHSHGGTPNWLVYSGKSRNGWLRGSPILGNLQIIHFHGSFPKKSHEHFWDSLMTMETPIEDVSWSHQLCPGHISWWPRCAACASMTCKNSCPAEGFMASSMDPWMPWYVWVCMVYIYIYLHYIH